MRLRKAHTGPTHRSKRVPRTKTLITKMQQMLAQFCSHSCLTSPHHARLTSASAYCASCINPTHLATSSCGEASLKYTPTVIKPSWNQWATTIRHGETLSSNLPSGYDPDELNSVSRQLTMQRRLTCRLYRPDIRRRYTQPPVCASVWDEICRFWRRCLTVTMTVTKPVQYRCFFSLVLFQDLVKYT